ncbi:hypothetical protein BGZ79_004758, partial [Entomortierella chlamydospora]
NERRVLRRASYLHEQDQDSEDIFADDLWRKYLLRPSGILFEDLNYKEFFTRYRQIFNASGIQRDPPYDEVIPEDDGKTVYLDRSNPTRKYRAYETGSECIVRFRATPLTDAEDACVHLIKLHYPTRLGCEGWLDETGLDSFFDIAAEWLPRNVLEDVMPLLPFPYDEELQQADGWIASALLNMEQRSVLDEIISNPGCHLVTGSAGTGKSTLLRSLIHHLKLDDDYEPIVLAPTGIAAEQKANDHN